MELAIEDLKKDNLALVKEQEVNEWAWEQVFAPGKLWLIPKGVTFRPIMTFNKKITTSGNWIGGSMTTNTKLLNSHMMLKTLKTRMFKENFGFAVFCYDDIMKKYEVFV